MKCNQCQGKLYRIDKWFAGWVLVFLAVIMGLPIHPALSLKFGIATYLWGVLFLVPAISLLRSKPRYTYWCSNCKSIVSVEEPEGKPDKADQ